METSKLFDLAGRVAVVTRGGGVIGGALALALTAQRARVAVLELALDAAERVAGEIAAEGGEAVGIAANVLDKDHFANAAADVVRRLRPVDIGHTPMGRFGVPEDLVGTLLWLVSPARAFVTSIVVPVDGGFSAFSGV